MRPLRGANHVEFLDEIYPTKTTREMGLLLYDENCITLTSLHVKHVTVYPIACPSDCQSVKAVDVKSSRLKWPRGQTFGLGLEVIASAWPRSRYLIM